MLQVFLVAHGATTFGLGVLRNCLGANFPCVGHLTVSRDGIGWELSRDLWFLGKNMLQIDLVIAASLPLFGCLRTRTQLVAYLRLRLRPNNLASALGLWWCLNLWMGTAMNLTSNVGAQLELFMGILAPVAYPGYYRIQRLKLWQTIYNLNCAPQVSHLFWFCTDHSISAVYDLDPRPLYWVDHTFYLSEISHEYWQTRILQKGDANVPSFPGIEPSVCH